MSVRALRRSMVERVTRNADRLNDKSAASRRACRRPLRSVWRALRVLLRPEATQAASLEVTVSHRVFRRVPYRLSGSPESSSVLLSPTLEVFRLAPSPLDLTRAVHPLSDFSPLQRPIRCRPLPLRTASCSRCSEASSHEVLRPSNAQARRIGLSDFTSTGCPASAPSNRFGSHRSTIPPRPFSGPRGVDPHHALWPCFVPLTLLGFFALQGFHPPHSSSWFVTRRYPHSVSPHVPSGEQVHRPFREAAPPGLCATRRPVPTVLEYCIQIERPNPS